MKKMYQATGYDLEMELWLRRRNEGQIVWSTKDGFEIPIKDMTDVHLDNALNKIRRNEKREEAYFEGLSGVIDKDWFF